MQLRPHRESDGYRVWLDEPERRELVTAAADTDPTRELAIRLGLHGLRSAEITRVDATDVTANHAHDRLASLRVDAKDTDEMDRVRHVPLRDRPARDLRHYGGVGVTTKTVRRWVSDAAGRLADETGDDRWTHVSPHDLRRTWATSLFYQLATSGVPAAETLVMSWGGWRQTPSGRQTFRKKYLGPVPDAIAADALDTAGWV